MNFTDTQLHDLGVAAAGIKVPWWNLGAVVMVESGGTAFALVKGKNLPLIRYEGHYVYRRLTGAARDAMVAAGLASPKAGGVPNPKAQADRYAMIERAVAICKAHGASLDVPYESCSWGVGQVMGANWKDLGYPSCKAFVADVCSGFAGQVRAMIGFVIFNSIDDELRLGQFAGFGRVYNGPDYKKNGYDTKMIAAAKLLSSTRLPGSSEIVPQVVVAQPDGMLRLGAKGRRVRELQALLVTSGATVKVDGDFGAATKDALKAFQRTSGLKADGVYGPDTESALAKFRPADLSNPGHQNLGDIPEVKTALAGGGGAIGVVLTAKKGLEEGVAQLAPYVSNLPWMESVQSALVLGATVAGLVALGYGLYGWVKSKRTVEV